MSTLYSLAQLEDMCGGDKEFIAKMKQIFEEEMVISLEKLHNAVPVKDYETIRVSSHTMKPSIDSLAILSIREEIRLIESLATQKADMGVIEPLIAKVDSVLHEVFKHMNAAE